MENTITPESAGTCGQSANSADNMRTREPLLETSPDWQQARMLGRREALNILMSSDPEDFIEEFMGNHSIADTGDYGTHWLEDKLSALLDAKEPSSLIERLHNSFYEQSYMEFAMREAIREAETFLTDIAEYWNRDENESAMSDACWHAVGTAEKALAKLQPFTTQEP
jgi:hypothetical protein